MLCVWSVNLYVQLQCALSERLKSLIASLDSHTRSTDLREVAASVCLAWRVTMVRPRG